MRRIYTAFVTIFWLTMIGLLFQKEVLPTFVITNPAGYEIDLTQDYPVRESWMGVYFKDKKIGFTNTVISEDVDGGVAGYRINETALLRLNMLGEGRLIRIRGSSFFSEDYLLKNFNYDFVSGEHKLYVSGFKRGDNLNLTIDIGGYRKESIVRINQDTVISNTLSPLLLFKKLDTDREINFDIFDPVTFGMNRVRIRNVGKGVMKFNKKEYEVNIFETDISGIKTKTWITKDGDILKEESLLGFTMHKEDPNKALDIAHTLSLDAQDLALEFSMPSDMEIVNPRDVSYLKICKNSDIIEIYKDEELTAENILHIPIQRIPNEDFIQSSHQKIIELAEKIVGDERNSWAACKLILHWVYSNLDKVPTLSIPSSLDVLRTMQGDCNEHTVLFTALTRSLGIPTEMVAGMVYLDNAFYYHAWPKVYIGRWINMDPTLGQEIADATHISILEGGLKEQIELIRVMGSLKIKVIDYR